MEFFDSTKKPIDLKKEGYSVTVLIDPDGTRKDFSTGWYDYDNKIWIMVNDLVPNIKQRHAKHLVWAYLPLAELDNIKGLGS